MSFRQDLLKASNKRKRRFLLFKILLGIGILSAALAIIVILFYVPSLRVSSIFISGLDVNDETELRAELFQILEGRKWLIVPENHMFFLPKKNIEEFLASKYRVRDFTVEKVFPSALDISITERKTWAIWCDGSGNNCLLLDRDGLAFEKSVILDGSAILKITDERDDDFLGENILLAEKFSKIAQLTEDVPKIIESDITSIRIKKSGETYYLYSKRSTYLIIDAETDVAKALENLSLALNSGEIRDRRDSLEYIDLRFPDKVFYKFR